MQPRGQNPKAPLPACGLYLSTVASLVAVILASPGAFGQLPLPQLGEAPDLRLASADAFVDRLRSARQRITNLARDREPSIKAEVTRLERQIARAESGDLAQDFDIGTARRLVEALRRERELRQEATQIIDRASQLALRTPGQEPASTTLDEVVLAADNVRKHERTVRRQYALAQRLRTLAGTGLTQLDGTTEIEQRTVRQQYRVNDAQADAAEAAALEAEATARLGRQQLVAIQRAWSPDPDRITAAETQLAKAELTAKEDKAKLRRLRARTSTVTRARSNESETERQARQAERSARVAAIGYRFGRIEAKVLRAQSRVATMRSRAGTFLVPPELESSALTVRISGIDQATTRIESRLGTLEDADGTRRLRRTVAKERSTLEQSLVTLRTAQQDLRRALLYAEIREGRTLAAPSRRPREVGFVLTILVIMAAVFLLARGYRWGQTLVRYQEMLPQKFRLSERQLGRLGTVSVLLWPIVVASVTAATLIWPVWGMSLTVSQALRLVDRPLFFVDETGVSVLSIVQLAFAIYAANVLSKALREFLQSRVYPQTEWDIGLTTALDTLIHYLIMIVGLIFALRSVGVGFSAFAILAGVLGIGIGFGLRNVTENFISGLIILAERPIKIGDFIQLGPGNLEGRVQRIRARSTTVTTRDNISIIIPNSEFVAGRVTNWSHGDHRVRIAIQVGVVYGSNSDLVRKALLDVAQRHGRVLSKPHPEVEFSAFGSSSLDFILRVWIDNEADRFRIASDLHFAIDSAFRKARIEIAFPQLDIHFKSAHRQFLESVESVRSVPATSSEPASTPDPGSTS